MPELKGDFGWETEVISVKCVCSVIELFFCPNFVSNGSESVCTLIKKWCGVLHNNTIY